MATNYREILRLAKLGYSQRSIAASAGCARSTVQRVLERAESNPHTLEELLALLDKGIQQALFPASSIPSTRKPPDYERVHRELAKNGVTLSLLWNEYCEECYASKEQPLMYTQFCLHYREYAQQTKATMHLDQNLGNKWRWTGREIPRRSLIQRQAAKPQRIFSLQSSLAVGTPMWRHSGTKAKRAGLPGTSTPTAILAGQPAF